MRVVQLLTQERGGPVDHALDVARELARRGHDSHVIAPIGAISPLRGSDVQVHAAEMRSKRDARGAVAVARAVQRLRPDVLHCQDRRAGLIGRVVARGLGSRPVVVYTLHGVADGLSDLVAGNALAGPRRRRDRWFYLTGERLLRRATGSEIVVPCEALARFAREQARLPPASVHVVRNGVDVDRFRPRAPVRHEQVTALWLGLMGAVKRVDLLVDAAAQVPALDLLLVGDGPERSRIAAGVRAAGLDGRVHLREHTTDPAPVFGRADIFVLSSAAEACPLALLQAMASGLPVVATRVGGVPEIVRHGTDGFLVPPGDAAAMAAALRRLAADPVLRATMGAAARSRAESTLSIRRCVDRLLEVYRLDRRAARKSGIPVANGPAVGRTAS